MKSLSRFSLDYSDLKLILMCVTNSEKSLCNSAVRSLLEDALWVVPSRYSFTQIFNRLFYLFFYYFFGKWHNECL